MPRRLGRIRMSDEGIKHLKECVEHGKAGHADVATQHAEGAVTHLSEVK